MREVACSVATTAPSGHNVEVLERKLIALRTEIDAILSLLAAGKIAAPSAIEAEPAAELESSEPFAAADASVNLGLVPRIQRAASVEASGEVDGQDPRDECEGTQAHHDTAPPMQAVASDQHAVTPAEAIAEAAVTPIAPTEVEPAASQPELPIDVAAEAAASSTPASATGEMPAQSAHPEPSATAAAEGSAAPVGAQVIDLQPRPGKPGVHRAAASAALRPRRRLAAKIAASIIALVAAATVLMLADEEAIGSAQSLPWISPEPTQSGSTWPFPVGRQGAGLETTSVEATSVEPTPAAGADTLLLRYREVWPLGW
jgi:hypothetical protein